MKGFIVDALFSVFFVAIVVINIVGFVLRENEFKD